MKIDYEITVDVSNADIETKKRVQDAFFKLGIKWSAGGNKYNHLHGVRLYTNQYAGLIFMDKLMFSMDTYREPTHTIDQLFELAGMKTETKLIPFDLEKALAGDPVVTRSGKHVTQITLFECNDKYPLVAVIEDEIYNFTRQGVFNINNQLGNNLDLFMKPKTRIINGFEVPAPESEPLEGADAYYVADTVSRFFYEVSLWSGGTIDMTWLSRGLVFLTKEDAIANAKAMLGINPYGDGDEQV